MINKKTKSTWLIIVVIAAVVLGIAFILQPQKINFWLTTQIMFPESASDIRHYSHVGGMGDGEDELTFKVSKDDTMKLLAKKPFGQDWSQGPYSGLESDKISSLTGSHKIENSSSVKYSIKYKNPNNIDFDPSYIILMIDPESGTVLLRESDF